MEEKNGVHSEFLHPNPAHCVRVEIMPEDNSKPHTAYLNIAQNKMVSQSRCERDKEGTQGILWHLPHTLSPPREEIVEGSKCRIYDVVFHPDTIRMGKTNSNFMSMLHKSAIDAVSSNFRVKVSPKYEIVAEKAYIGKAEPCILRTPLPAPGSDAAKNYMADDLSKKSKPKKSGKQKEEEIREDLAKFMENRPARTKSKVSGLRTRWEGLPGVNDDGTLLPRWQIKDNADPSKKEDLVVSFWLPELENSKNLKIDILDKNLGLKTVNQEKKYHCTISLPYNVESKISKAIFKNTERILEIKLPIAMDKISFDDAVNNIEPPEIPLEPVDKRGPKFELTEEELAEELRRISEQPHRSLAELIPAHNLSLPDFKASESERWCLFEVNVSAVPLDLDNDCEITENGFHLANKFDPAIKNIGLSVTVGNGGIQKHECHKQLAEGKNVLEVKLRKTNDGLLKHFNMGKTRNSLESYRFDVLISDRQVTQPQEPLSKATAHYLPTCNTSRQSGSPPQSKPLPLKTDQ
ncbi:unnamed protein product [Oikopleura dioica]|uniref:Protein kintoun n=1 Tax=Oikopleura dioica TaxID=34765 RepID=E4YCC0_OIKDI|nr:unnamed protein product [Oikopleura dioica]